MDARVNTAVDPSTSDKNLVNFGLWSSNPRVLQARLRWRATRCALPRISCSTCVIMSPACIDVRCAVRCVVLSCGAGWCMNQTVLELPGERRNFPHCGCQSLYFTMGRPLAPRCRPPLLFSFFLNSATGTGLQTNYSLQVLLRANLQPVKGRTSICLELWMQANRVATSKVKVEAWALAR